MLIADDFSTLGDDSISGEDLDNRNPATAEELCTWKFAKCLQPDGHTYTQVLVQTLQQQPLADCCSELNISKESSKAKGQA
jgi:hypothetical protein